MEEIDKAVVAKAIHEPDPMMEVLSSLLRSVATDAVSGLAQVLTMINVNPSSMPGQYFMQATLVAADGVFQPVTREEWMDCYDSYQQVKKVLEENPELRAALTERKLAASQSTAPEVNEVDPLLDGEF